MEQPAAPAARQARPSTIRVAESIVTLVVMGVALLALDDITTDNATGFRPEYTMLALAGAWLAVFVVRLWRSGRPALAGTSGLLLVAATGVAMDGIGHGRDGGWSVFRTEYSTLTAAWLTFAVIPAALLRQGWRRERGRAR